LNKLTGVGPEHRETHIFIKGSATKLPPHADEGVTQILSGPVTFLPKYGVGHFFTHYLVIVYL
jgi:hypothetical protein